MEWTAQLISWTSKLGPSTRNLTRTAVHYGYYIGTVFNINLGTEEGETNYVDCEEYS